MNNNLISNLNVSTPIKFASDNNKAKAINTVKQESLIDRYVNSAYEASKGAGTLYWWNAGFCDIIQKQAGEVAWQGILG